MDPNLIHLDWERAGEALGLIIVLAFVIERALAVVFENQVFITKLERPGLKEFIAVAVSIAVCVGWKFDAISMFLLTEETRCWGYILTGAIIAGGSKASIKLFHDLLDIKSTVYDQRYHIQLRNAVAEAEKVLARAKLKKEPLPKLVSEVTPIYATADRLASTIGTDDARMEAVRVLAIKAEIEAMITPPVPTPSPLP